MTIRDARQQILDLVAEARLCCDAFTLGTDSLITRQVMPAALSELTALKRMGERTAEAMEALQAALSANMDEPACCNDLEGRLSRAIEALEFYGDEDVYESRPGKTSAVGRDKGHTAREALCELAIIVDEIGGHRS